jgi:D-alanyl-lipoteichoic acid acyltransferase DltB (MBOAT superfamily)
MQFNSLEYLIFLPVVVALYFALPHRFRWMLLLGASYFFYMCWKAEYALLILLSTLVDYWAALRMGTTEQRRKRRTYLVISLIVNLGLLFSFKYFNFVSDSLQGLVGSFELSRDLPMLNVLLPVGISFYTFQTLSYTIDVYRGVREPEHHFGIFAVYVSFFPQLVAGPIERSTRLLPQFLEKHRFEYDRVIDGLRLMLWGFFKKIVIADRLAVYVNEVYGHPGDFSTGPLLLATYFFAFQIYCDFSGYTDIAIGSARIMGYDLMENFRRPYFAKSIAEFWRRWHISLSTWFRDYLYFSLGGNRVWRWRWYYNLIVVFTLSGLWHGADWTFLVWGALHGAYMIVSDLTRTLRQKIVTALRLSRRTTLRKWLQVGITFHLVVLAWVFFRANSLGDAVVVLRNIAAFDLADLATELTRGFYVNDLSRGWFDLGVALAGIGLLLGVQLAQRGRGVASSLAMRPVWQRWALYYAAVLAIILFGVYEHAEFIYFQF